MKKETPSWLSILIPILISSYLLYVFHSSVNLANPQNLQPIHYLVLLMGVLIPLVPFINKLRIGKLIELERSIQQQKNEVQDFKNEVRQLISVVSTSVNSISNLSNTTNVNFGFLDQLTTAKEQLNQPDAFQPDPVEIQEVKDEMYLENEDSIMALCKIRIRLENLLRNILGKGIQTSKKPSDDVKFLSAGRLYRMFLRDYADYKYLEASFEYVLNICNAAIHGQQIPPGQAQEAIDLGVRLISTLNELVNNENHLRIN